MTKRKKFTSKLHKSRPDKGLKNKILAYLYKYPNHSFSSKQISKGIKIRDRAAKDLIGFHLRNFVVSGLIQERANNKYRIVEQNESERLIGKIDLIKSGSAYFLNENGPDIYISSKNLNRALNGDRVEIAIFRNERKGKKAEGEVIGIIERARTSYLGIIETLNGNAFLTTERVGRDIFIHGSKLNGAKNGQRAIVKLLDWPEKAKNPFGEVIEILGDAGDHEVEIHAILAEFGLPATFDKELEKEAEKFTEDLTDEDLKTRRDFRDICTFTIDPDDAKDFDDALSFQKLENGNWEIGIHIADVSYYLDKSDILEEEAFRRATSVYLVDRVVPMLPESLSNKLCSLRPKETKRCFSAVFELDENAIVKKRWIGRTLINSDHRFTYMEAQKVIEDKAGDYAEELLTLDKLAKIMREKRMNEGAISFDRAEVKFKLDEEANPIKVYFKHSLDAHKLIEEYMLLANKQVAQYIGAKLNGDPSGQTFVYRIHDKPDPEKITSFSQFVNQFGFELKTESSQLSNSMNSLLEEVKNSPFAQMVETLAMRSMSKAKYSTANIGHYGLGFSYYSHFTSPIRRYPDVMVHRLLQHYLEGGSSPGADQYEFACKHSSSMEKIASDAERSSTKYMQVKFLEDKKDIIFEGVVSGVTEWGLYVEIIENKCEGMVALRSIKEDYYIADTKNYVVEGQMSGHQIRLGDRINVKIANTNLLKKTIDMDLILEKSLVN